MSGDGPVRRDALAPALVLGGAALASFWPSLVAMVGRWSTDPRYSHGYLVPLFALALPYLRGPSGSEPVVAAAGPRSAGWTGVGLVAAGMLAHLAGALVYLEWLEGIALVPTLAGLVLLVGGWPAARRYEPSVAFLAFMVPLPFRVENALGGPLQRLATGTSTFALQTLGLAAVGEGNVIVLNGMRLNVVEACSGLSMLILFFALATGLTLVVARPAWERVVIVASAVPIALVANIARITGTGIAAEVAGPRFATVVLHDLAGWLMIPLALGLLGLELALLSRLVVATPLAAADDAAAAAPSRMGVAAGGHRPPVPACEVVS